MWLAVSLAHTDVRGDNIIITNSDGAVLVDRPWAAVGAPWVDAVTVLVNVRVFDPGYDADAVLRSHGVFTLATAESVNGFPVRPGRLLHRRRPAAASSGPSHSPGFPAAAGRNGHSLAAGEALRLRIYSWLVTLLPFDRVRGGRKRDTHCTTICASGRRTF